MPMPCWLYMFCIQDLELIRVKFSEFNGLLSNSCVTCSKNEVMTPNQTVMQD